MKIKLNTVILFFLLADNLYLPVDLGFDFRFNYIVFFCYIIYTILKNKTVVLNKNIIVFSIAMLPFLLIIPVIKGYSPLLTIKQLILVYINFFVSFILLNSYNFDLIKLMKDYVNLIYIAAIVGLIQFVFQRFGFTYLSNFSYLGFDMGYYKSVPESRIQSWFLEPSFLAYAFMPVAFLGVARIFNLVNLISLKKSIIILFVVVLSQSAIGILGILLSLIIVVFSKYSILHKPRILITTGLIALLIGIGFYNSPEIKFRVDDTFKLFYSDKITTQKVNSTNLSTYALYSNFRITKEAVKRNPLFGTGLGTYEQNYDTYLYQVIPESSYRKHYKINRKDANSLLLRTLTELGLIGIILMFFFLISYRIKLNTEKFSSFRLNLWAINNGILVLVFIRLLRQGHYTMLGFSLFILLYFFTRKQIDEKLKENIN